MGKKLFSMPIAPRDQKDLFQRWFPEFQARLEATFRAIANAPGAGTSAGGAGTLPSVIDTDILLGGANPSDDVVPSQRAAKTYVDAGLARVVHPALGPGEFTLLTSPDGTRKGGWICGNDGQPAWVSVT